MITRNEYNDLINNEKQHTFEEERQIKDIEDFFSDSKTYDGYIPQATKDMLDGYEHQIAFLNNIKELNLGKLNTNQEKALEHGKKIISIIPKIEQRRLKEENINAQTLKRTLKNEKRAGYTNASIILFIVLNVGLLIAALLLSIK